MLKIDQEMKGTDLIFTLEGRLDTTTAPQLENELKKSLDGVKKLTFDFKALEYISSAGLRVLLWAQKTMNTQGEMKVLHVQSDIMDVFTITGFADVLTIE